MSSASTILPATGFLAAPTTGAATGLTFQNAATLVRCGMDRQYDGIAARIVHFDGLGLPMVMGKGLIHWRQRLLGAPYLEG